MRELEEHLIVSLMLGQFVLLLFLAMIGLYALNRLMELIYAQGMHNRFVHFLIICLYAQAVYFGMQFSGMHTLPIVANFFYLFFLLGITEWISKAKK